MRLSTSLALAALGLAASALPAAAGTLLVPQQFPTIQKALNAAKPYDTVLVSPKAGKAAYSEALAISTPHIVLQGCNNPVIDGAALGQVITPAYPFQPYTNYPTAIDIHADHVAVRGLTIQNFPPTYVGSNSGVNVGYFSSDGSTAYSFSDIEISGNTFLNDADGVTISGSTGKFSYASYSYTGPIQSGYRLLGNVFKNNGGAGATLSGNAVLVSGNKFLGNVGDGLNVTGTGVAVSGNEAASNGRYGLNISASTYNPAINNPSSSNPAPTVVALNLVHDNGSYGLSLQGTATVSGNIISKNTGYGVYLSAADFSTVAANVISGTALDSYGEDDNGTGVYADISASYTGADSGLKISFNQISGNAGDGVYFYGYTGGVVSGNAVTGNQGIGIHLSDDAYVYAFDGYSPASTVVTQNRALHNTVFDARDDAAASGTVTYNNEDYTGDGVPTINVWTNNLFGTTDPVGLSK